MFQQSIDVILPLLHNLFNRLFSTGTFPKCWSESLIIPLHKKGSVNNPENYRGISLLDVLGKIYTSILNRRITFYVNMYGKISEAQFGFREGYLTIDNAFILNSVIEKYLSKEKGKLYVCFVDFKRAFDSVNRQKLWCVLKADGLKGNLFKVNMYESVKACVRINNECTDFFECKWGLRQGCLLSPILFSMFVYEFTKIIEIIETSGLRGIQLFPDLMELFLLLFSDDIALISDTKSGLQKQLSLLSPFCKEYKITVHIGKTKVVVFRKSGQLRNTDSWTYNGEYIEVINSFQYVGLLFTQTLSLYKMTEDLASKAKRILVALLNLLYEYGTIPKTVVFTLSS